MSYRQNIAKEQLKHYAEISDWSTYYATMVKRFKVTNPGMNISYLTINIEDKIFLEDVIFDQVYECHIKFKNCYFFKDIVFYDTTINGNLSFAQCYCDLEIRILENSNFKKEFNLIEVWVKGQMIVNGGIFNECRWSLLDYPRLLINAGEFKELSIGVWGKGSKIQELNIKSDNISGHINIMNDETILNELWITGIADKLSITIEHISVNLFHIYRFRNDKAFRVSNIRAIVNKTGSQFSIFGSYLGPSEFNSIDFTTFAEFFIKESNLLESSFSNIIWPKKIHALTARRIARSDDEKSFETKIKSITYKQGFPHFYISSFDNISKVRLYFSKEREVYRQLKYASSKQGDNINEQLFHSQEMKSYYLSISWKNNFWTKAVILFSDIFGDFGRSISRPIFWLIAGHWVLFLILLKSGYFPNLHLSVHQPDFNGFRYGLEHFLYLLNPLRRFENNFYGFTIIVDLLMRIWSTYMIYNFVRASRRFIK